VPAGDQRTQRQQADNSEEGNTVTTLDQAPAVEAVTVPPVRQDARNYHPTERDAKRHAHIGKLLDRAVGTGSRPYYDSVVIVGAGFSASVMAARLARSEQFHGKVVIAGPRTEESRRMKDGATLRGHGTDYICYALDVPQYAYVDALYGDIVDGRGVGTRNQVTMAAKGSSGTYEFGPIASFQGGKKGFARPLFYGARNSRMQAAIYELMDRDGVIEVPEPVSSLDQAFSLALGKRPLVVNASHNSGLLSGQAPEVDWATSAVQAPLKVRAGGFKTVETNEREPGVLGQVARANAQRRGVGLAVDLADLVDAQGRAEHVVERSVAVEDLQRAGEDGAGLGVERESVVLLQDDEGHAVVGQAKGGDQSDGSGPDHDDGQLVALRCAVDAHGHSLEKARSRVRVEPVMVAASESR